MSAAALPLPRGIVLSANMPWLPFPFAAIWRMRRDDPFGAAAP